MRQKRFAEEIADGVWIVRGGFPTKTMNVYLVKCSGDGVFAFDAGIKGMATRIKKAADQLGGLKKIVLGHGHPDHRGAAGKLGVPVYCHEAERADAEGDGGRHYFHFERLSPLARRAYPFMLRQWDSGPLQIAGTLREGDIVEDEFEVVHLPGHAPGQIALWRKRDRLALTSDCFYVINPETGLKCSPSLPHRAFNQDSAQVAASIKKLAALDPYAAWPGHSDPLLRDVRQQLEAIKV